MTRILLTTTSFQDTPGPHHEKLESRGFEIVRQRGPLPEDVMLDLAGDFDAFLCGDDAITRAVLEKSLPRLKIVSKYGVGLDKIDLDAAKDLGVTVTNCPGVNQITVAEHAIGLMFAVYRRIVTECNHVRQGEWKRITGHEVMGKTLGIIGLGRIGKELALRAGAFGINMVGYDVYWPQGFAAVNKIERAETIEDLIPKCDIISLHCNLSEETHNLFNRERIAMMKDDAVLINCARGELVDNVAMAEALNANRIWGYGADVLDQEPPQPGHPLFSCENAVLTPHIGSRTFESVERQAMMAVDNLTLFLDGKEPLAKVC